MTVNIHKGANLMFDAVREVVMWQYALKIPLLKMAFRGIF